MGSLNPVLRASMYLCFNDPTMSAFAWQPYPAEYIALDSKAFDLP